MKGFKHISTHLYSATLMVVMLLLCANFSYAQQEPLYSQYMNNMMSLNPAYTGVRGVGSASMITRKQWLNLPESPFYTNLSVSLPFDSLHVGTGFDFMYENVGPTNTVAFFFDYAYRIKATPNTQLSFGLKGGFSYLQANLIELDRYHEDDSYIIEHGDFTSFMPNFGVGLFWFNENFYAGLSVPKLLQNKYIKDQVSTEAASKEERHYSIHGAYLFDLSPNFIFKPAITTYMVSGAPLTADFDFGFMFQKMVWLGAKYRISDAVGGYVQFQVENLKIGVSYDYSHTRLSQFNRGTYEIMLRYDFKLKATQVFPILGF